MEGIYYGRLRDYLALAGFFAEEDLLAGFLAELVLVVLFLAVVVVVLVAAGAGVEGAGATAGAGAGLAGMMEVGSVVAGATAGASTVPLMRNTTGEFLALELTVTLLEKGPTRCVS